MPDIYAQALAYRQQLFDRDDAALVRLAAAYQPVVVSLTNQLDALTQQIAAAQANGEIVSQAWLLRQARFQSLLHQIAAQVERYNLQNVLPGTAAQQQALALLGADHAANLIAAQHPDVVSTFGRLPVVAIEQFVGQAGDGTPLGKFLKGYGKELAGNVRDTMLTGLAGGKGIAPTAREVAQLINRPRWEAARLVRTESLRAYREASRAQYKASGFVQQWEWVASQSRRTCAACLALDGKVFSVEKPMPSHISCRCTAIPIITGAPPRERQTGAEWFATQPADVQAEIIGDSGVAAYQSGKVTLADFVGVTKSKQWGETRSQTGLLRALKNAQKPQPQPKPAPKPVVKPPTPPPVPKPVVPPKPVPVPKPVPPKPAPKPAPPPVGPSGAPVAPALTLPTGALGKRAKRLLGLIDGVHGDGKLPVIPLQQDAPKSRNGAYWHNTRTGNAGKITISKHAPSPELTLAHEIGHFLDHQGAGNKVFASATAPEFAAWRDAVKASQAVQELRRLQTQRTVDVDVNGKQVTYRLDQRHITYLLSDEERWARSYAQYIAVRSGDTTLLQQLDSTRIRGQVYYPRQWDDDDFEPIAQAIDALFMQLGWRK